MNETELAVLGRTIRCQWVVLDDGVQILLTGGDLSHIGAVSAAEPDTPARTLLFPGHRDQDLAEPWAETLAAALHCHVCVTCGIHFDNLSREGLSEVLAAAQILLERVKTALLPSGT